MWAFLPAHPVKKPAGPGTKARPTSDTTNAPGSPLRGAAGVIGGPVRGCRRVEGRLARTDGQVRGAHLLLDQLVVAASPARLHRLPVDWSLIFLAFSYKYEIGSISYLYSLLLIEIPFPQDTEQPLHWLQEARPQPG